MRTIPNDTMLNNLVSLQGGADSETPYRVKMPEGADMWKQKS